MKSFFNFNGIKLLFCSVIGIFIPIQLVFAAVPNEGFVPDHYIVTLQPNEQATSKASEMARTHGFNLRHVYKHALNGFAAFIPPGRLNALRRDPRVVSIEQDQYVSISKKCSSPPCGGGGNEDSTPPPPTLQEIPTGISRIGGLGIGSIDIDVAVIDTGIDSTHSDLNVFDGYNCSKGRSTNFNDGNGHGTHVAGTIGALDNNEGVVGVAPGARLWAVRVLNNAGSGFRSDVICGIDWVTGKADIIEVANMSLGGSGSDGACNSDSYHQAICNSVDAGVTYVVAAGNSSEDSSSYAPATYGEVITVSALADFDGEPGGNGTPTCRTDEDDTFANFSNYGTDVDIIAPGVCILSTWKDGGYNTISGTSMASPHVAGAAALYLSINPDKTPTEVKEALKNTGNFNWNNSDDGDGMKERLVDISSF